MAWEARKYKDIADTLTSNIDQLELNIKVIGGYLHILDSKVANELLEAVKDNISDIRSDITDLKGTTTAIQNTVKDYHYELSRVLEVE